MGSWSTRRPRVAAADPWCSGNLPSSRILPAPSLGSLVSGQWSLVSGLWSVVSGLWSLVLWSLVSSLWSLASGLWSRVSGLWSLASGLWSLVFGLSLSLSGCWSLVSRSTARALQHECMELRTHEGLKQLVSSYDRVMADQASLQELWLGGKPVDFPRGSSSKLGLCARPGDRRTKARTACLLGLPRSWSRSGAANRRSPL